MQHTGLNNPLVAFRYDVTSISRLGLGAGTRADTGARTGTDARTGTGVRTGARTGTGARAGTSF